MSLSVLVSTQQSISSLPASSFWFSLYKLSNVGLSTSKVRLSDQQSWRFPWVSPHLWYLYSDEDPFDHQHILDCKSMPVPSSHILCLLFCLAQLCTRIFGNSHMFPWNKLGFVYTNFGQMEFRGRKHTLPKYMQSPDFTWGWWSFSWDHLVNLVMLGTWWSDA